MNVKIKKAIVLLTIVMLYTLNVSSLVFAGSDTPESDFEEGVSKLNALLETVTLNVSQKREIDAQEIKLKTEAISILREKKENKKTRRALEADLLKQEITETEKQEKTKRVEALRERRRQLKIMEKNLAFQGMMSLKRILTAEQYKLFSEQLDQKYGVSEETLKKLPDTK